MIFIQNARSTKSGGGFGIQKGLKVSTGSRLIIRNATAGNSGGGFYANGKTTITRSTVSIQNATAQQHGGGFCAEGAAVIQDSTVAMFSTDAGADGGAFSVFGLTLHRSQMSVSHSTALGSGFGGRVDGQVLLSAQSTLVVKDSQGLDNSGVLAAGCLHLRDRSRILFEDARGGHGVQLQNSGCSDVCSNSTFYVEADAALNASGRLSSGFLSLASCPKEKVHLSGIHLHSWSSALLSTRPSSVIIGQVTIDYEPPIDNLQVLAAKDGFDIDSLTVSCRNCPWGVTFNATKDRSLKAVSSEYLECSKTVTASKGLTQRCNCSNYQIATEHFRGVDLVPLESSLQTCMFCKPHFHFQNDDCRKCGILNAWSDGKKDVCHVLPRQNSAELFALLTGAAVVVILTFLAFEILHAPLMIVDAKSYLDPRQAESKTIFTFSVQGPIVDLPKSLARLVNRMVRFRAKGTGLIWLDYDQKKSNAIKVRSIARRKLLLQDTSPPFFCASCKGSLHAADFAYLLILLTACIFVGAMLPVIIKVAVISGNGVGHVFVTTIYVTLPLVAVAALLHFPIAWLIQRFYRRTSFSEALDEYRKQIKCKPFPGPDGTHPRNQGLQVLTLRGLWMHFESFILERNMHFVVANIVRPLTQSKGVSFVSLWGGRQVDYFVSHSWGTSFPHFVCSIQCHALSKEGPTSWIDAAYWICSFANNQWRIEAELGNDPMESAFALALTAGIKGVAMVMDPEAQPLTRVWCLFEFFLSSRQHLDLVFVTNAGVVGDDGCSSFDVALEMGKKIESLQVETCEASSEEDKNDIFQYIISELGSLERMDEQIRALMAEMLMQNLANMEKATGSLVDRLGQGSATVATLNEKRLKPHDDPPRLCALARHQAPCAQAAAAALDQRVTKDATPRGSHPVSQPVAETGARHLQDCEVIGWAELCERKKLTAGSCFQLQPTAEAPLCELQGPHGAPAQLRPATAGILTLTSGELRITGNVRQDSEVVIENVSAKSGAGFLATGNVYISDDSMIFIQNSRSTKNGGGFSTRRLRVSNSSVVSLQNVSAGKHGGGFNALGEVEIAWNSTVKISNSRAESGDGGGFDTEKGLKVSTGSRLIIRNATAGGSGGGFLAKGKTLISRSTISIQNATAQEIGGGFCASDEVVINEMSSVSISSSRSGVQGGGFHTDERLQVTNSSAVSLQNVIAQEYGGGFNALGEVEIAGNSTVKISNSRAEAKNGGGFDTEKGLKVSTGSRLIIRNAAAGNHGGGFFAKGKTLISRSTISIQNATAQEIGGGFCASDEVVINEMSSVSISTSRSRFGGGFHADERLQVTNRSAVSLQNVTAQKYGGGFNAIGDVEIAGHSTVKISNSRAEAQNGGGFDTEKGLKVSNGSRLIIRNAAAGNHGGGFFAKGKTLISRSTVNIQNATARQLGGGFSAERVAVIQDSTVAMFSTDAGADGGAFAVLALSLHRSSMSISNSTALGSGSGGLADGQVLLLSESNLVVKDAQGLDNSGVLAAGCLHLRDRSRILFEDARGGHGVQLQNSGCSDVCSNSTFYVEADAALNASGRLSSGFLSLASCPKEKVHLSGIHLHSWSSALLSTRPSSVIIGQVTIDYEPPIDNLQVLAAKDGLKASAGDSVGRRLLQAARDFGCSGFD
ncbi:unnamed protein product [Cladocopium goreaui]|uniref:Outer membrane protein PmpB n=1 Tax=Cladocopium goreaui TaxID=2562237 RepID=A0A9P1FT34_9DINO|nr:unnamed protein product [Cladocopium goreaui]